MFNQTQKLFSEFISTNKYLYKPKKILGLGALKANGKWKLHISGYIIIFILITKYVLFKLDSY